MKKTFKRVLAGLIAVATMGTLVACNGGGGSQGGSSAGPSGQVDENGVTLDNITLTYWHYEDPTTMELMAAKFTELYPNITVEVKQISDMSADLSAAAAAGTFPDVFSGTDSDTALSNQYWADITKYVEEDPETAELMATVEEYGIGKFDTSVRFAMPTYFQPSAIFIDRNVIDRLGLTMPDTDWTWDEMIQLIKDATVDDRSGMKTYGLGYYNRLDSLYGIAACSSAERAIKGEFGFNGTDFDLSYWAVGEQQFSDLKLGGYVAPQQDSQAMEDWSGDYSTWFGATGHVAVFSEGFWTYMNLWGVEGYQEQYGLDIVPYVTPNVVDEKEHNIISTMFLGGVSTSCKYPYEAYLLLKFMGWGIDGWKARLEIYSDPANVNAANVALKNSNMPVPMTLNEEIWAGYKALFPEYENGDTEKIQYWDDYFASITRPTPYGWYSIAGYWNFCDSYFNKIGIHDLCDNGTAHAADYVDEATEQANYYHAMGMISYFGPDGYNILSEDELAQYQAVIDNFGK